MKRVLATAVLAGIATVALSTGAHAAGNANAKIMLHALAKTTKNQCLRPANIPATCSAYDPGVNNLALYPTNYFAYALVVNGSQTEGIAGAQFGLSYQGGVDPLGGFTPISVYGWTLCATLEFSSPSPAWPNPGSGNLVTWNATGPQCTAPPGNATIGAVGVAGYFYMAAYETSLFRLIPRPADGVAKVANCGSVEDNVIVNPDDNQTFLGALGFGRPGINPCGRVVIVAVEPSTWSGVKTLVGSN
jgi:hypothetical protein